MDRFVISSHFVLQMIDEMYENISRAKDCNSYFVPGSLASTSGLRVGTPYAAWVVAGSDCCLGVRGEALLYHESDCC